MGAHGAGKMSDADLHELEAVACPGAGACGGQFTANTMALVCEFLGIAAAGSGNVPANDPKKAEVARQAGERLMTLVRDGVRPRDIMTRPAFDNAIASVATTGGSTNAVLHLMAIAHEAGVALALDDFDRISAKVPLLADLKPSGRFVATDLYAAGGTALVAQRLIEAGVLAGDAPTVTGRTIGEEAAMAVETPGQQVVRPIGHPIKTTGGLVIVYGNLAPEGAVIKVSGAGRARASRARRASSTARMRRSHAVQASSHSARRRRRHPLRRAERRSGHARDAGGDERADGRRTRRFGGARDRWPILGRDARLHGRPRGARSVPRRSAGRRPRRRCRLSSTSRIVVWTSSSSDAELAERMRAWRAPAPRYATGVMAKYAKLVSSASMGAVTG